MRVRRHGDPGVAALDAVELAGVARADHGVPGVAALDAVAQVGGAEQRGARDHHGAEPDAGQDRLPQLDLVAQHQQHPVAALHAEPAQPRGDLPGAAGHLAPGHLLVVGAVVDHPQGRLVGARSGRDGVEPVLGEIEVLEPRPGELGPGRGVVLAQLDQPVARLPEPLRRVGHGAILSPPAGSGQRAHPVAARVVGELDAAERLEQGWEVHPEAPAVAVAQPVEPAHRVVGRAAPRLDGALLRLLLLVGRTESTQSPCSSSQACRSSSACSRYLRVVEPTWHTRAGGSASSSRYIV